MILGVNWVLGFLCVKRMGVFIEFKFLYFNLFKNVCCLVVFKFLNMSVKGFRGWFFKSCNFFMV